MLPRTHTRAREHSPWCGAGRTQRGDLRQPFQPGSLPLALGGRPPLLADCERATSGGRSASSFKARATPQASIVEALAEGARYAPGV